MIPYRAASQKKEAEETLHGNGDKQTLTGRLLPWISYYGSAAIDEFGLDGAMDGCNFTLQVPFDLLGDRQVH